MNVGWDDVRLFLAVVEAGSITGAARALGLGQPTISRRVAELEEQLGYQLFQRKVSGIALTAQAEKLVPAAKRMAEWAAEIGRTAARGEGAPEGVVRIAAPPGVAFDFLAPFAGWMRSKLPKVTVQILANVAYVDLVRGEADLALRMRGSTSPDLKVLKVLEHANAAFASRAYAAKLPKKYGFGDIDWIGWAPPYEDLPPNPQLEALIPNWRPSFTSDNFLIHLRAAEAGLGAIVLGDVRHRFSRDSPLVPLSLDLGPHARSALYLMCARTSLEIPRVKAVAELLAQELVRDEGQGGVARSRR